MMADHGEMGFQGFGFPDHQTHGFGLIHGLSPVAAAATAANFFDHEGSAYLGELEEAFMRDAVGMATESEKKAFLSATPTTLEIFPSWPMRLHHPPPSGNSQSPESTESGSARQSSGGGSSGKGKGRAGEVLKQEEEQGGSEAAASRSRADGRGVQEKKLDRCFTAEKTQDPKTLRRLAQNREAARKSRLRKKAYVQQLESSRVRLAQLEQDLQRARSQGLFIGEAGGGNTLGNITPGAALFNMEYWRWLEEDQVQMMELREGLRTRLADGDLRVAIDSCLAHYNKLFRLRAAAADIDVFHLVSGMWTTPAERCFLWMGGFRPSEILKIMVVQLDPLTGEQLMCIRNLQQSSQHAEEALSQGLEQLQRSLANTVAGDSTADSGNVGDYFMNQMSLALAKLSNLEGLVKQADNLRQQTLHQLHQILTTRQMGRCFLVLGEYRNRLRALSSLWASQSRANPAGEDNTMDAQRSYEQHISGRFGTSLQFPGGEMERGVCLPFGM